LYNCATFFIFKSFRYQGKLFFEKNYDNATFATLYRASKQLIP